MKAATRDWVTKAEGDYLAATALARRRKVPLHDQVKVIRREAWLALGL